MGATLRPLCQEGEGGSALRNRVPARPQAPRKGVAGEQTPGSRSNLFRPTFLQFGYERNPAYPLALLRKHGDSQSSKLDPLHEREARPVREP